MPWLFWVECIESFCASARQVGSAETGLAGPVRRRPTPRQGVLRALGFEQRAAQIRRELAVSRIGLNRQFAGGNRTGRIERVEGDGTELAAFLVGVVERQRRVVFPRRVVGEWPDPFALQGRPRPEMEQRQAGRGFGQFPDQFWVVLECRLAEGDVLEQVQQRAFGLHGRVRGWPKTE